VVGTLILASLTEGFNVLNLGANYQYLVQGVVIIAAAAVYTVAGRRRHATITSGGQQSAPGAGAQDETAQDRSSVPAEHGPKGAGVRGLTSEAGLCRARRERIAHRAPGGECGEKEEDVRSGNATGRPWPGLRRVHPLPEPAAQ